MWAIVSYIIARTSYILSAISWREQVTFCQLYHGENKLQFVSYIMARTSCILSAISWREQVTFCQLYHGENNLHFVSSIMATTSYILSAISWREHVAFRWDECDINFVLDKHDQLDVYSASSMKQQSTGRHAAPLWHIILILLRQPFALTSLLAKKQQTSIS